MAEEAPQKSRWLRLLMPILAGFGAAAGLIALYPSWRESVRAHIFPPFRKVLSVAEGHFPDGNRFKVVKIRTHDGLFLEIYASQGDATPLMNRIQLPDRRDAYFHFRGQATNLALEDINGDELLEILAPTFDEDLTAHLNVYSYNAQTRVFEPHRRP